MKHTIVSTLFSCLVLTSCQISGLTTGYNLLSQQQKERVVNYKGSIDSISDYSCVYNITAEQVKDYVSTHKKVLVYDYTPFCKAPSCIAPNLLLNSCKRKGIDLLVVANIYDEIFLHVDKGFPMLMMDATAYNTKWRWKYDNRFIYALIGRLPKEVRDASYHYFNNGKYIGSYQFASDILQLVEDVVDNK